ncbi:GntR family transcriptional regulator [Amaricoccus sp. B4]|uniref:GntR family transcriptional regulator n=1 Tax=Amaricoccus sp. B4 TaxID=3368557 RepID=UPI00371933EB
MAIKPFAASEKPRERGSDAQFVYGRLRNEILDLSLAPGGPIDEVRLAKQVRASRAPFREALALLQLKSSSVHSPTARRSFLKLTSSISSTSSTLWHRSIVS